MAEEKTGEAPKYARREFLKKGAILALGLVGAACEKLPGLENISAASRKHWGERIEDYPLMIIVEHPKDEDVNVHNLPTFIESSIIGKTPSKGGEFEAYKVKGQLLPGHESYQDPETKEEYGVWYQGQSIPNADKEAPPLSGFLAAAYVGAAKPEKAEE